MNFLILTCRFGCGHYMAMEAIKENILLMNKDANIHTIDVLNYLYPNVSKGIYHTFNFMVNKYPKMYNFLEGTADKSNKAPFEKYGTKKLDQYLKHNKVDVFISTFPLCTQYVAMYKKIYKSKIPLYTYITDIYPQSEWINDYNDKYFVGSSDTKNVLIKKGVASEKIIISGIPVCDKFKHHNLNVCRKSDKEILIMGGGLGIIPLSHELLDRFSKDEEMKLNITLITGKNKKLYRYMKKNYPKINTIGFTNDVDKYMEKADLLITKAGGITMFEAIFTETPMVVIDPFLMQEVDNAKYIENNGIGIVVETKNEYMYEIICNLLNNEKELNQMRSNMRIIKNNLVNVEISDYFME